MSRMRDNHLQACGRTSQIHDNRLVSVKGRALRVFPCFTGKPYVCNVLRPHVMLLPTRAAFFCGMCYMCILRSDWSRDTG